MRHPTTEAEAVQIGIVSWGNGCGLNYPGVYVNVPVIREWIDKVLRDNYIPSAAATGMLEPDMVSVTRPSEPEEGWIMDWALYPAETRRGAYRNSNQIVL